VRTVKSVFLLYKTAILILCCAVFPVAMICAGEAVLPVTSSVFIAEPVTAAASAVTQESVTKAASIFASPIPVTAAAIAVDFGAAMKKSVQSSTAIKQALAEYKEAKALLEKEKGVFDPFFKAGVMYSESADKSIALQYPEAEKILEYKAALNSRLITGGDISLIFNSSRAALLFPAFSGSVDASLFWPSINPYYYPEIILSYTQPLLKGFWGGAAGMKVQAAEYRAKAAAENLRERVIAAAYDLKAAYYEVYLRDIFLKAAVNYAKETENMYSRMKAGGKGEADLLQAKAAMIIAGAGIKPMEKKLAVCREAYLSLAGYAPAEWAVTVVEAEGVTEDVYVPQDLTEELESTLVELQPAVTAAKFIVFAAEAAKNAAENNALPQLNVIGSCGLNGFSGSLGGAFDDIGTGKFGDFMVGADFSWSLPNRAGFGGADAAKEEFNKMRAGHEAVINLIRIKIRAAYAGITAEKEYYFAAKEARLLLEKRVKLLQQAFDSGSASARDALLAHLDRFNARKSEAEAFNAYALAIMDWNRVNGKYDYFYNEYLKNQLIIKN
jgi:outer membrane protein TolC